MLIESLHLHPGRQLLFVCVSIALIWTALPAQAKEDSTQLTLEECIEIGLEQATSVANAARDEEIAEARIKQARSEAFPQISVNANYTRLDETGEFDIGSGPVSLGDINNYGVSASVNQLLYSGGKVRAALRAAALSRDYARLGAIRARAALIRDITTAFHNVLLARAACEINEESVAHLRNTVKQAQAKFASGTASEFDVLSAKVRLANEIPKLTSASNDLIVAKEAFRMLVGLDEKPFQLVGELTCEQEDWKLEDLQRDGLAARPEVLELRTVVDMLKQDVIAARSRARPSLKASFGYTGANSYQLAPFDSDWEWHWSATMSLQWNILDGGLTKNTVLNKTLEMEKTSADLHELCRAVRLDIRSEHLNMLRARTAVEAGKETVELAKKAHAIATTRYESGAGTYLELQEANLALGVARLTYFQALRDHMNAVAKLRYACGMKMREKDSTK